MISLVGPEYATEFPLPLPTPELQERLDALYDAGRLGDLIDPHGSLGSVAGEWPAPPVTEWPAPRLGSIYWPVVGAARYAFAALLVDEYTLGQLRAQMTMAVDNLITVKLRDDPDDAAEAARSVPMRFLATRPLVRTTSDALTTSDTGTEAVDAWVLILVDDRYWTNTSGATSLTATAWSDVFTSLGATVSDAVDADYLTPGARWTLNRVRGRSTGWLADVAALSVGSRIVKTPSSGYLVQRPTSANRTVLSDAHSAAAAASRFVGGGPIETADFYPGRPNTVRVTFGAPGEAVPVTVDVVHQTDYNWAATAYLSHWADAPASTSGGNRGNLAAQWEADWEQWQIGTYDTLYSGFVAAPASGFLWAVEWYHDSGRATTRFVRPPYWYGYLTPPRPGSTASGIATPEEDAVVTTDAAGDLQNVPQYVVETPGDVSVTQYVLSALSADPTTTPIRQLVVENDGTPSITQYALTDGTSGGNGVIDTLTPTQYVVNNTLNGVTAYNGVRETGGVMQFVTAAKSDFTQGVVTTPTQSGGNVTALTVDHKIWNGSAVVTGTESVTYSGGQTVKTFDYQKMDMTALAELDVSGVTVTGLSGYQPLDDQLTAIAALIPTGVPLTFQVPGFTGSGPAGAVLLEVSDFSRSLLALTPASLWRTSLGLEIGTDVQAYDAELAALAGLTSAANKLPYFTGSGAAALADYTAEARTLTALTDPGADRIVFWDDSAGAYAHLTVGSGLSITGTTITSSGGGDALTTNPLSQFAATTSAQLAGVISDETGSGALVFATSPTLVTPALGTPSSGDLSNCTGTATGLTVGNATLAATVSSVNEASDTTCFPLFITASGTQNLQTRNSTALTFNSSTGALGATSLASSGTGGSGHYVKQTSAGAAFTTGTIAAADYPTFVAAGGSAAKGAVPSPGATAYTNHPRLLGSQAAFVKHTGGTLDYDQVVTTETTTSTSATGADLATVQELSFTLDESCDVIVTVTVSVANSAAGNLGRLYLDIDGAGGVIIGRDVAVSAGTFSSRAVDYIITGMSAAAHTIRLKFSVTAGTGSFANRTIVARILG